MAAYLNMDEFKLYQKQAIEAADDLNYGPDVIARIKQATTNSEIARIMRQARLNKR